MRSRVVEQNSELQLQQLPPPVLDEVAARINESVSFWIPIGRPASSRLCIFRAEPQRSVRVHWPVGTTLPFDTGGSTGRMMRAFANPRHREDDRIRAERVCTTWAERDPELCAASAPVFGVDGTFVGVLSISDPISRRNRKWLESMRPVVSEAAEKITSRLDRDSVHGRE